jgi:hypothetical protein
LEACSYAMRLASAAFLWLLCSLQPSKCVDLELEPRRRNRNKRNKTRGLFLNLLAPAFDVKRELFRDPEVVLIRLIYCSVGSSEVGRTPASHQPLLDLVGVVKPYTVHECTGTKKGHL